MLISYWINHWLHGKAVITAQYATDNASLTFYRIQKKVLYGMDACQTLYRQLLCVSSYVDHAKDNKMWFHTDIRSFFVSNLQHIKLIYGFNLQDVTINKLQIVTLTFS